MPDPELKEWIALIKDAALGLAALVTITLSIYGVRIWKRDLVGKEVYAAAKELVKASHLTLRATSSLRQPIQPYERKIFTDSEIKNTTENERWRISEAEAYRSRVEKIAIILKDYDAKQLELRVLVGSKVYLSFLPFGKLVTEAINRVNNYLDIINDHSQLVFPESEEIFRLQKKLYPSHEPNDELSEKLADAREEGEISLLPYLHRKSIRG